MVKWFREFGLAKRHRSRTDMIAAVLQAAAGGETRGNCGEHRHAARGPGDALGSLRCEIGCRHLGIPSIHWAMSSSCSERASLRAREIRLLARSGASPGRTASASSSAMAPRRCSDR